MLKYLRVPGLSFPGCDFVSLSHFFSVDMSGTEKSYDAEKDLPGPLSDTIRNGSLDKSVLQNAGDGDEALKAFASHQGEVIELDEATNKRLLRKIDWNLMPVCIPKKTTPSSNSY